jgi:hypothetical protein
MSHTLYPLDGKWKMVDCSIRADLPHFHLVDENNLVRFLISGTWKNFYNNKLLIREIKEPYTHILPREPKPKEADALRNMYYIMSTLNTGHTHVTPRLAKRKPDYYGK